MNKIIPQFELKSKVTYPKILNDEIKLLSFNSENSVLIGSASYKIQKYPADIDLYEQIRTCCSRENAVEYFKLGIKEIVNKIKRKENHWVIEVKCGIDDRYDIINQGYDLIHNNNFGTFLRDSMNIINMSDYEKLKRLNSMIKISKNPKDIIDNIIKILRNYYYIRWSADNIEIGWVVRFGKKFYLEDCIDTHSPINIEIIAIINNKFTDLSNFFVLMFHDKLSDRDVVVNFPQNYITDSKNFVINGLKEGINKVLFSGAFLDVFKGIKRMYSLARITNDLELYNKISPIISSDLSALSQLKSELSTLEEILDFTDNLPWRVVYDQLESIRWRLGGNTYISENEILFLSEKISEILSNKNDINFMKNTITNVRDYIFKIVNSEATDYLNFVNLYRLF